METWSNVDMRCYDCQDIEDNEDDDDIEGDIDHDEPK